MVICHSSSRKLIQSQSHLSIVSIELTTRMVCCMWKTLNKYVLVAQTESILQPFGMPDPLDMSLSSYLGVSEERWILNNFTDKAHIDDMVSAMTRNSRE